MPVSQTKAATMPSLSCKQEEKLVKLQKYPVSYIQSCSMKYPVLMQARNQLMPSQDCLQLQILYIRHCSPQTKQTAVKKDSLQKKP